MKLPIGPSDYYELYPSGDHQSGDVWSDLPTHGVLGTPRLPCVVITPACDLVNRKVESLTYLPILSVSAYLGSRSHLPEILRATNGQLEASGLRWGSIDHRGDSLPGLEILSSMRDALSSRRAQTHLNAREETAAIRAEAGLTAAVGLYTGSEGKALVPQLKVLFGEREFTATARRLVTNAHRADVHFLPGDDQRAEWSVIREPSVALFRYPLSIPIDILDLAQAVGEPAWPVEAARLRSLYPCVDALMLARPLKSLRIRPRFLSDLLTRFTGLYGRIGSPDFGDGTINRYVTEIGATS